MAARISGIFFQNALRSVLYRDHTNNPLSGFRLYRGTLPSALTDTLSDTNCLSTTGAGGISAGETTMPSTICWAIPSGGVTMLSSQVAVPIRASGLPASPVPGFLRFRMGTETVMDIEVSGNKGNQVAQVSTVAPVTAGQVMSIMDMRFKIATSGAVSFNNATASAILKQMTAQTSYIAIPAAGGYGYYTGLPYVAAFNPTTAVTTYTAAPITASAYDGPIPASANLQATGTKLWEKSYSSTSEMAQNIWNVAGSGMELTHTFTANALADGTPTYIRILKNEVITTGTSTVAASNYPRFELQVPVGAGSGFANFTVNSFVAGQPATLNPFTISFMLPEVI